MSTPVTENPNPLRAIRLAKGKSLRWLSLATDVDIAHLSRVERGEKSLSLASLHRVAAALELHELDSLLSPWLRDRT